MTRVRRLLVDIGIYGGGRAAGALVPLLLLPFLTRRYAVEEFGTLELLLVVTTVLGGPISGGVSGAYLGLVRGPDYRGRTAALLGACMLWFLLLPPVLLGGGILLLPPLVSLLAERQVTVPEMLLCCWLAFAQQLLTFLTTVLRMDDRAAWVTIIAVGGSVLAAVLTIAIVSLQGATAASYLMGFGLGLSLANAVALRVITRTYGRVVLTPLELPRVLSVGLPLVPGQLAELALTVSDRLIIAAFLEASRLAVYAVAVRVASLAQQAIQAVMMALLPLAMRLAQREGRALVGRLLGLLWRYAALVFLAGAIAGTWLSSAIVHVVAPPHYAEAASVVPYLMLAHVFFGFTYFTYIGTLKAERTHLYSISVLIGAAVNVGLSVSLTPRLGLLGAAIGMVAGSLLTPVISLAFSQIAWPLELPVRRIAAMSALAVLCVAGAGALEGRVPEAGRLAGTALVLCSLAALAAGRGDRELLQQLDEPGGAG
jgi:O-antigen/teichoic acid export membrane protein